MGADPGRPFPMAMAVTGGIGSGKSRVARWLADACALPLYDADEEVRSLLLPGRPGWQRLRARLAPEYFGDDGSLLKARLRQRIFVDTDLRRVVEHEIHPLVLANLKAKIAGLTSPCLVEIPLLYEAHWEGYFAVALVVYADDATCLQRLMRRDRMTRDQAQAAVKAQMPIMEKVRMADRTVDNSGAWSDTVRQLEEIRVHGIATMVVSQRSRGPVR